MFQKKASQLVLPVLILLMSSNFSQANQACEQIFNQHSKELHRGPFLKNRAWESFKKAMESVPLDSKEHPLFYESDLWMDIKNFNKTSARDSFNFMPKIFAESFEHPKFILRTSNWGYGRFSNNIVMLHGDVFIEGYYRNRYFEKNYETDTHQSDFKYFKDIQPWFAFNEKSQSYQFRTDGMTERIISHLPKNTQNEVTLYRGLKRHDEALTIDLAQKIRNADGDQKSIGFITTQLNELKTNTEFEPLKNSIPDIIKLIQKPDFNEQREMIIQSLLKARFDHSAQESFFTTPDKETALKYGGQNPYLKIKVNAKTLKNLASKNSLYAGVEYEFIEILFRGSESIYSILDEISILRPLINSEENKR